MLDDGHLVSVFLLFLVTCFGSSVFCGLVKHLTASIFELEGKDRDRFVDTPDLLNLELDLLRAAFDRVLGDGHLGDKLDDRLSWNLASERDHALANVVTLEKHGLHSGVALSAYDETRISFAS